MRVRVCQGFVLGGLLLSACAGVPPHEGLPPAAKDQIASTEVVVPIQQSEIYVFVPQETAGAANGLIGALVDVTVDAIRTSKAEKSVKRLRDALVDYNFDTVMQRQVQTALLQLPWLHVDNVHVIKETTSDSLDQALASSKDAAVMFTTADYQLSNDGSVLTVTVTASLFPKSDALRALKQGRSSSTLSAPANSLYHDTLKFEMRGPKATTDRDSNMDNWSANNGAAARAGLNQAAAKLSWLLAQDLQSTMTSPSGAIANTDNSGSLTREQNGTLSFVALSAAP